MLHRYGYVLYTIHPSGKLSGMAMQWQIHYTNSENISSATSELVTGICSLTSYLPKSKADLFETQMYTFPENHQELNLVSLRHILQPTKPVKLRLQAQYFVYAIVLMSL